MCTVVDNIIIPGTDASPLSESPPIVACFESILMSETIAKYWNDEWLRLKRWVEQKGFMEHRWRVKTWDEDTEACAHLECLECREFYGEGAMVPKAIANCFTNFRTKHLVADKHENNFCRQRGMPGILMQADDTVKRLGFDHGVAIATGMQIVTRLNEEIPSNAEVFSMTPSPTDP